MPIALVGMTGGGRFLRMACALAVVAAPWVTPTAAHAVAPVAQKLGLTVWAVNGNPVVNAIGSIVAVAQAPVAAPGQATENKWSVAHAVYFERSSAVYGVVSLDNDGSKRFASIALNGDSGLIGFQRLAVDWQPGRLYLPLASVQGNTLVGFIYDFSTATWRLIGSVALPAGVGRLSPVSTTYVGWYGATQPDCASYPRVDVYRQGPLGSVTGEPQPRPSTAQSDHVLQSGCPASVTADPDVTWRRYVSGSPTGPASDWPKANIDDVNSRFSQLSAINSQNVNQLAVAWTGRVAAAANFGAFGGMNPIVVDGTAYYQDLNSDVYAVDAQTGAAKWSRLYAAGNIGPNGVAVEAGRVFVTKSMNTVAALDAATGAELWTKTIANSATQGVTTQMAVANGTLYFSTVPAPTVTEFYPPGGMGILYALDAATGTERWSFNTVKDGDLWGHPEINSGGGAWYPPAIDRETGTTYWAIGNPAPFPGTAQYPNGTSRPGPNLYTNSMLAIDHSGTLLWYQQVTPHDIFDYDFEASPILTTATINGAARRLVLGAGKSGEVLAFDAADGAVVWRVKVGLHLNDNVTAIPPGATLEIRPGYIGGVMSPMALADGLLYVTVADTKSFYTSTDTTHVLGGTGELLALDVRTGQTAWRADLDGPIYAGATVARDLVFTATVGGKVAAYQRTTGNLAWAWQAPAGVAAPLAVTGDSLLVPVGTGASPGVVALRLAG